MPERFLSERKLARSRYAESFPPVELYSTDSAEQIVILVPGIRTNADWIDAAAKEMGFLAPKVRVFKVFGGRISSFHLVTRVSLSKITTKIESQISQIVRDNQGKEISLICHSMGTDIIANILDRNRYHFKYIFFVGAICHTKHASVIRKSCGYFVNHRGSRDPWPLIATIVRPYRYSTSGVFGFNASAHVNDIIFDNDHSSCTSKYHVYNYIIDVIIGKNPIYLQDLSKPLFSLNLFYYLRNIIYASFLLGSVGFVAALSWVMLLLTGFLLFKWAILLMSVPVITSLFVLIILLKREILSWLKANFPQVTRRT